MRDYVTAAMAQARFDQLSDGTWFGALPRFHAVYASATTQELCRKALEEDLRYAIAEAVRQRRQLPPFGDIAQPTASDLEQRGV